MPNVKRVYTFGNGKAEGEAESILKIQRAEAEGYLYKKQSEVKALELIKNLGVIVLLIGVVVLAVPAFTGGMSNTILLSGLGLIILGYLGHIVINKRFE